MARPLFIVCCESGVVDRYTNAVSAFNIVEAVQYHEGPEAVNVEGSTPFFTLKILATWIGDDADRPHKFQHQTRIRLPGHEWRTIYEGEFSWSSKNQRFVVDLRGVPINTDGTLLVVNAIKRADQPESEWLEQQYEIAVLGPGVPAVTD